ncbi:MAG: YraN family protein [Thermoguttaceae bacterium]
MSHRRTSWRRWWQQLVREVWTLYRETFARRILAKDKLGRDGERLAAEFLVRSGYRIIGRNLRLAGGEADVIALDGNEVVFVEVKTRRSDRHGSPENAIDDRKRRVLTRLAAAFVQQRRYRKLAWRIDVVAIVWTDGSPPQITHHKNAITGSD